MGGQLTGSCDSAAVHSNLLQMSETDIQPVDLEILSALIGQGVSCPLLHNVINMTGTGQTIKRTPSRSVTLASSTGPPRLRPEGHLLSKDKYNLFVFEPAVKREDLRWR